MNTENRVQEVLLVIKVIVLARGDIARGSSTEGGNAGGSDSSSNRGRKETYL